MNFCLKMFCGESIFGIFVFISCAGIFPRYLVFGFLICICYRFSIGGHTDLGIFAAWASENIVRKILLLSGLSLFISLFSLFFLFFVWWRPGFSFLCFLGAPRGAAASSRMARCFLPPFPSLSTRVGRRFTLPLSLFLSLFFFFSLSLSLFSLSLSLSMSLSLACIQPVVSQ